MQYSVFFEQRLHLDLQFMSNALPFLILRGKRVRIGRYLTGGALNGWITSSLTLRRGITRGTIASDWTIASLRGSRRGL